MASIWFGHRDTDARPGRRLTAMLGLAIAAGCDSASRVTCTLANEDSRTVANVVIDCAGDVHQIGDLESDETKTIVAFPRNHAGVITLYFDAPEGATRFYGLSGYIEKSNFEGQVVAVFKDGQVQLKEDTIRVRSRY